MIVGLPVTAGTDSAADLDNGLATAKGAATAMNPQVQLIIVNII